MRAGALSFIVAAVVGLVVASAGYARAQEASDAQIIADWKAYVLNYENLTKYTDGEDITWKTTPYLGAMVTMGEATGDTESLDAFCKGWEHLQSLASTDIDGLFGWPTEKGSYGRNGKRCIPMDDAIITEDVARFVRLVRSDPKLKARYGERAEAYLKWVEEKIWPKWEDSWLELTGTIESTRRIDNNYTPVKIKLEKPCGVYRFYNPGKKPGMSLPLNQFLHVAMCYLDLYDVTGNEAYMDKATKMGWAAKQIYLVPEADRWSHWNYWQPVWPGDYKRANDPVHWVGPHPNRPGYASGEVAMMARMHKRGIVFTDEDMQRFVRRLLDVLWNKDLENPKFEFTMKGRDKPYPGTLWSSLDYIDPTIAKMTAGRKGRAGLQAMSSWQRISGVPAYFLRQKEANE